MCGDTTITESKKKKDTTKRASNDAIEWGKLLLNRAARVLRLGNGAFTKHTTAPFVFTGQRVTRERDIHRNERKGVVDMIILQTKISLQDVGKCFNPEM